MDESRVTVRLSDCDETVNGPTITCCDAATDAVVLVRDSGTEEKRQVPEADGLLAHIGKPRNGIRFEAGDSEDDDADHELPVGITDGKCETSSMRSECHIGATACDSMVPSCSDVEADTTPSAVYQLPINVAEEECSRLEMERGCSRGAVSNTCESVCRRTFSRTEEAAGDAQVPSWSDVDESEHFEGASLFDTTAEGSPEHDELGEGWATDLSTISSEVEECVWKEIRHGRRRPLQGSKQYTKRLPRAALAALFDAVDGIIGDVAPSSAGLSGGTRLLVRGSVNVNVNVFRRCGPGCRGANPAEPHPTEGAPTEADVWATKRLLATLEAIDSRLENVERCVQSYGANVVGKPEEAMAEQRLLLMEVEKRVAGVISLVGEQRSRRPFLQAKVELLMRRLMRLRDALRTGGGWTTELDVQLALKGVRKHLRTAQGAAARLSQLQAGDGEG